MTTNNPSQKHQQILYLRTFWCDLSAGGSISHTLGVLNALNKKATVTVLSNQHLHHLETSQPNVVYKIQKKYSVLPMSLQTLLYNFSLFFSQQQWIKKKQFDLCYSRLWNTNCLALLLYYSHKLPFIVEYNSSEIWKLKHWTTHSNRLIFLLKWIYFHCFYFHLLAIIEHLHFKHAQFIIVVSDILKDDLIRKGVSKHKILVQPNGVNPARFPTSLTGEMIRNEYDLKNRFVIGFLSTFGVWHGSIELVKAILSILEKKKIPIDTLSVLMIGDGPLKQQTEATVNQTVFKDNFIFTGTQPYEKIPHFLVACDCLVSPQIPNPDGTPFFGSPTKLFEYMASSKAIIASRLGQLSDILEHQKTALLVEAGNITDLSDAIITLYQDTELRNTIGNKARESVLLKYTWDIHIDNLLNKISLSSSQ